jgi:hypothetical protein
LVKENVPQVLHVFAYYIDEICWFEILCKPDSPLNKCFFANDAAKGARIISSLNIKIDKKISNLDTKTWLQS